MSATLQKNQAKTLSPNRIMKKMAINSLPDQKYTITQKNYSKSEISV